MEKKPFIFAVCGRKNTGKTTLITRLVAVLTARGFRVATIKHDGHDFSADIPNTDTYRHMAAGAYGTAIFSNNKFMVIKKQENTEAEELRSLFPEADIILLEGCKGSDYPKMQMRCSDEKEQLICNQQNFVAYISDGMPIDGVAWYHRDDIEPIAEAILTEKMIRENLSMVVLAGGLSSRMGQDKADLPYGEETFLEHQIAKGRNMGIEDILVSGYRGEHCTAKVVADKHIERGPLGGLASTLPCAAHERCLVVTVDMPQLPVEILRQLVHRSRKSDKAVTILRHGEKREPLVGVYHRKVTEDIEKALLAGKGAVMALLDKVGYEEFVCTEETGAFENVNTMADYAAIGGKGRCTQ